MKRCPQCKFIYLDTDDLCDLDGTPLVPVTDAEVDAVAGGQSAKAKTPKRNRALVIAAMATLALAAILFIFYYAATRIRQQPAKVQEQSQNELTVTPLPTAQQGRSTEPTPPSLASPEPSSSAAAKSNPLSHSGSQRPSVNSNPVSTGGNGGAKTGSVIRLTNGASIEADEVWRTKEGFWYRRNGIVTLIKADRVKAIEKTTSR